MMVSDKYTRARILAIGLAVLLTVVGLFIPPSMFSDCGWGMLQWRTLIAGGPINTVISPDPIDISRDSQKFVAYWTPGQYLMPGLFTLLGLKMGSALSITSGLSLLCGLLGWVSVVKYFRLGGRVGIVFVLLVGTFRYSTLPFSIYNGGEILLQGATPWLILIGCIIPTVGAMGAFGLASLAVAFGFFVKLTGGIIAGAALAGGLIITLVTSKKITPGMLGGFFGAIATGAILYTTLVSRGTTAASGSGWSFRVGDILFPILVPWGSGVSWMDMLNWVFLNPNRPIFHNQMTILWFVFPVTAAIAGFILGGWRRCEDRQQLGNLLIVTASIYTLSSLLLMILWLHGGGPAPEERHFRSAGTLIFLCVIAVSDRASNKFAWQRGAMAVFCVAMSVYGVLSLIQRTYSSKRQDVDTYTNTRQTMIDPAAIQFVKSRLANEGRESIVVLPTPEIAVAFPPGDRILATNLSFEPLPMVAARRYGGKVRGYVYIIIQTHIAKDIKGRTFLRDFVDYAPHAWTQKQFGATTLFFQGNSHSETPSAI